MNGARCPSQVLARDRKVSTRVVNLGVSLPAASAGQLRFDQHMCAGARRRQLRIAVKALDKAQCLGRKSSVDTSAFVQVDSTEGICFSENESDPIALKSPLSKSDVLVCAPGLRFVAGS